MLQNCQYPTSPEEENRLICIWKSLPPENEQAQEILNHVIRRNLGYIIRSANRFADQVSLEDLIQEGVTGLLYALRKYDPGRGVTFLTYAAPWIDQRIARYAGKNKSIIWVTNRTKQIAHQIRCIGKDGQNNGNLDVREIARELRAKPSSVRQACCPVTVSSLDAPISAETEEPLGALIPAEDCQRPEVVAEENEIIEIVAQAIEILAQENPLEAEIIVLYYVYELTLQEIGERMGVSRETARQIKEKAIRNMRYYINT